MKRCKQCSQRPGKNYYHLSATHKYTNITRITLCPKCHKSRESDLWHILFENAEDAKIQQVTQALQHYMV